MINRIEIAQNSYDDLRNNDVLLDLAKKLERYVYNPAVSNHPRYQPYQIEHGSEIRIIPYDVIRIRNSTSAPVRMELDAEAAINAEKIVVTYPEKSYISGKTRSIPTGGISAGKPIIGIYSYEIEEEAAAEENEEETQTMEKQRR